MDLKKKNSRIQESVQEIFLMRCAPRPAVFFVRLTAFSLPATRFSTSCLRRFARGSLVSTTARRRLRWSICSLRASVSYSLSVVGADSLPFRSFADVSSKNNYGSSSSLRFTRRLELTYHE